MKELAKRENLIGVKFSGLLTVFPEGEGVRETVAAYFHASLEIFGADKVKFGPVSGTAVGMESGRKPSEIRHRNFPPRSATRFSAATRSAPTASTESRGELDG
jgi:hypothetical protein